MFRVDRLIFYVVNLLFVVSLRFPVLMTEEPENCSASIQLMEPEFALYWKTVCRHLQTEAQAKLFSLILCFVFFWHGLLNCLLVLFVYEGRKGVSIVKYI